MDESLYPTLQSTDGAQAQVQSDAIPNFMEDKVKLLQKDLAHYKKIKSKWSVANTVLKVTGISVSCVLAGITILTAGPLSVPIAAGILGGVSLGNATVTNLLVEGFTSKRKKYFQQKCDYIKSYQDKMEVLLLKSKEDGQVTPTEFKLFQELLKEYESETRLKSAIKSKDLKKIEAKAKKQVREQQKNILLHETIQKFQRTMS